MKDSYTRKEVLEITNNYASQIAKLRKQLDNNAKMFAKLMHESIELAWMQIEDDNEEGNSCS